MGGIYLIQEGGGLIEMPERPYEAEDILQRLLADYPNLLAGDQIDRASPRRWLLVSREAAVPGEEGGAGRWSLDHLFLDQDAVPTLVEVKRSTDTRIRREVVGQMLDYAANGVVYWPAEAMRAQFERTCERRGTDPAEALVALLGPDGDHDAFWQVAKQNLQAGRVRLVFVADHIPTELQRVVEFLNGQMDPAEVLAVEIKQYVGQSQQALVPRLVGQTAAAQQKKRVASDSGTLWDEASFFPELEARRGTEEARAARAIYDWSQTKGLSMHWGKGDSYGYFSPRMDEANEIGSKAKVRINGRVSIEFPELAKRPPFADEGMRLALLQRLNEVPGITLPSTDITRSPSIRLAALVAPAAMRQFLEVLDWLLQQIVAAKA